MTKGSYGVQVKPADVLRWDAVSSQGWWQKELPEMIFVNVNPNWIDIHLLDAYHS